MPKQPSTEVMNVRLPDEVLELLDKLIEQKLFSSRSEAIRSFCREYMEEQK